MSAIRFTFTGDSRDARRAADQMQGALRGVSAQAQRTAATTSTSMAKSSSAIQRQASAAAVAAKAGLLTAGAAAIFVGLKFDDLKQRSMIAFETMLGGAKEARQFLGELEAFAKRTPFEFPDLIRASQRLVALGFEAKNVVPIMTAVGDAVAAMGGDPMALESTVRSIGQIQAKGRLQAEEMMQLNEAGTFSWRALAREIGTSVPKAMDLVKSGAVTSEIFLQAFMRNSQRNFEGMMDRQSRTFGGLLSTVKDNMRSFLGQAMMPLFRDASKAMDGLNKRLDSPEGREGAKKVGKALREILDAARQLAKEAWPIIVEGARALKQVAGAARTIIGPMLNAVEATIGFKDAIIVLMSIAFVAKMAAWAGAMKAFIGVQAAGAAGSGALGAASAAGLLRARLASLAKLGVITVAISLVLTDDGRQLLGKIAELAGGGADWLVSNLPGDDGSNTDWDPSDMNVPPDPGGPARRLKGMERSGQALGAKGRSWPQVVEAMEPYGLTKKEMAAVFKGWKRGKKTGRAPAPIGSPGTGRVSGDIGNVEPGVLDMGSEISGAYGAPLNVMSGYRRGSKVADSNKTSLHASGNAIDLGPYYGATLIKVGRAALISAGMPTAQAMKHTTFYGSVNGWEIIFNCNPCGGDHTDHVHVGWRGILDGKKAPRRSGDTSGALDLSSPLDVGAGAGADAGSTAAGTARDSSLDFLPKGSRKRYRALGVQLSDAQLTGTLKDDLKALLSMRDILRDARKGASGERRREINEALNEVKADIADIAEQQAEAARAARAAARQRFQQEVAALVKRPELARGAEGMGVAASSQWREAWRRIQEQTRRAIKEASRMGRAGMGFGKEMLQQLMGLPSDMTFEVQDKWGNAITMGVQELMVKVRAAMARLAQAMRAGNKKAVEAALRELERYGDLARTAISSANERAAQAARDLVDKLATAVDRAKDRVRRAFDRMMDLAFRAFDKQTDKLIREARVTVTVLGRTFEFFEGAITPAERALERLRKQMEAISSSRSMRDATENLEEAQKELNKLIAEGADEDQITAARRRVRDAEEAINDLRLQDLERHLQERAEKEREEAEKALEAERQRIAEEREMLREALVAELAEITRAAEAGEITWDEALKRMNAALLAAGLGPETVAAILGVAGAQAFRDAIDEITAAIRDLISALKDLSDAENEVGGFGEGQTGNGAGGGGRAQPMQHGGRWLGYGSGLVRAHRGEAWVPAGGLRRLARAMTGQAMGGDAAGDLVMSVAAGRRRGLATYPRLIGPPASMGGVSSSAGGGVTIIIQNPTLLGRAPEIAEELARTLKPALDRRVVGFDR